MNRRIYRGTMCYSDMRKLLFVCHGNEVFRIFCIFLPNRSTFIDTFCTKRKWFPKISAICPLPRNQAGGTLCYRLYSFL